MSILAILKSSEGTFAMNVSLTPHLEQFIKDQVDSGSYASASEVIRASLRKWEREEAQLDHLRAQMADARAQIDRGEVVRESETFWDDLTSEVDARIAREKRVSNAET
jgi:antitoxin ParD1/3/4